MAHNLSTHTDATGIARSSFYSLRQAGWHNLGRVVEKPLSDPGILDAAGLNWSADTLPLYTNAMDPVSSHLAVKRSDTSAILGVVGTGYKPLQNAALLDFFRDVAGTADMTIETAGALGAGEVVWALARIPGLTLQKGEDMSQGYMLIRNNHDGQSSVRVVPTMVRVVCQNTLRMAESAEHRSRRANGRNTLSGGYTVRHTSGMVAALADIADAYARTMKDYEETRAAFSALTSKPLSSAAFDKLMAAVFAREDGEAEGKRAAAMSKARADKVAAILASPTCNVAGTAGTLWAGLNAITEYVDHDARTRGAADDSDAAQRFASSCFGGEGDKRKATAWEAALALV
jgi:phage/plasmid-like protein (TIGR03299 family)